MKYLIPLIFLGLAAMWIVICLLSALATGGQ